jgi:hypothetical protein
MRTNFCPSIWLYYVADFPRSIDEYVELTEMKCATTVEHYTCSPQNNSLDVPEVWDIDLITETGHPSSLMRLALE